PEGSTARRASSAHTYRLLIFKDRVRIHYRTSTTRRQHHNYPAPLRSASLHQQQRNEIMKNFRYVVNRFFQLPEPAHLAESLATAGSPASRAPVSEARKSEILASQTPPCKRYFDKRINDA
ncbi:hypothetical protein, partial [Paraburkholderia sediminicola]|uniref:hypothetical protein n=1 Tax=Paraburkholderia sediminicola TaxID=458836 RepID=UPI0038B7932E